MKQPLGAILGSLFLPTQQLDLLYRQLQQAGYTIVAPQVIDGAVQYAVATSPDSLPTGFTDTQQPGRYRLQQVDSTQHFGWSSSAGGIKAQLFPPQQPLWRSQRGDDGQLRFYTIEDPVEPVALFGIRACDLAAIKKMDRHFLRTGEEDPWYHQQRTRMLLISVSCSHAAENCFCVSTESGPVAEHGFDLRLDELGSGFLLWAGSEQGEAIIAPLQLEPATTEQLAQGKQQLKRVVEQQQKQIATNDFRSHFAGAEESPLWQQIAERCLGCGNCTAVCPTCFCHREEEVADLDLQQSTHQRVWDSCFSDEHSQLHGIPVRTGRRERYRQWLTHKLAGWHDQFGDSGCVGCGRCITWCPAGIDLVAESARFTGGKRE